MHPSIPFLPPRLVVAAGCLLLAACCLPLMPGYVLRVRGPPSGYYGRAATRTRRWTRPSELENKTHAPFLVAPRPPQSPHLPSSIDSDPKTPAFPWRSDQRAFEPVWGRTCHLRVGNWLDLSKRFATLNSTSLTSAYCSRLLPCSSTAARH